MQGAEVSWIFSDDLGLAWVVVTLAIASLAIVLLLLESRQADRHRLATLASGVAAVVLFAVAVLRPAQVTQRSSSMGAKVVVLVDGSRRLLIDAGGESRRARALRTVEALRKHLEQTRLSVLQFGSGPLEVLDPDDSKLLLSTESDLSHALSQVSGAEEKPDAIVVLSDGRLTHPTQSIDGERLESLVQGVPVHTVRLADKDPSDAAIRSVRTANAAVAHQPLSLTIEVGCSGGLSCQEIPVTVEELGYGTAKATLARGVAQIKDGLGKIELQITLDRAGTRVVAVSIDAPEGDTIVENNSRITTFAVTRDRLRLLHVAGRPTYDVRSLRMWLKSDESVDLIAFFILRTNEDDPNTTSNAELALIPFPVDELFTEHLPSFDAVILQDIDAVRYNLAKHLPSLARYVETGGGLIMVGGLTSFASGSYAGTALERVLPVSLLSSEKPFDLEQFVPNYTEAGRVAPVLKGLRELLGTALPEMPGTNTLGPPRSSSIVLWEHPRKRVAGGVMPVLALGEAGDGRSIALAVDGTHLLAFSELSAEASGRSFGALWDGLLGWLMRDPRFEAARTELVGECLEGQPTRLVLSRLPNMQGNVTLTLERLGQSEKQEPIVQKIENPPKGPIEITLPPLKAGGYAARSQIGAAPATRYDFACERGGQAWSDSRVDPARLRAIAGATGAQAVSWDDVTSIAVPQPLEVATERRAQAVLPPWVWALGAALSLGAHWLLRRQGGLS